MTALRQWYDALPEAERTRELRKVQEALDVTEAAVRHWMSGHRKPPYEADRIAALERVTGLSRHDLRPDVFGHSPDAAA